MSNTNRSGSTTAQASHLKWLIVDHYGVCGGRVAEGADHRVLQLSTSLNEETSECYVRALNHWTKGDCEYVCMCVTELHRWYVVMVVV